MALLGKIKASTLLESIVAMTIIVLVLGIGVHVAGTVLGADVSKVQLEAHLLLNTAAIADGDSIHRVQVPQDGIRIIKSLADYKTADLQDGQLFLVVLTAIDSHGKHVAVHKTIKIGSSE